MKKYVFIFIAAVVLALMTLPSFLGQEEEFKKTELDASVFDAETNPLLKKVDTSDDLGTGLTTNSFEGEGIKIVPIPNAEGDVVAEPIPNANSEDYEAVNLPYTPGVDDTQLGEGVSIKTEEGVVHEEGITPVN